MVMAHGWSGSLEDWRANGYVDSLKSARRLILVDARGHGHSGKPHIPEAYDMRTLASDLLAVLDDLGLDKATFWGYSMGGRIGFGLAEVAADRFDAFILSSIDPRNGYPERFHRRAAALKGGMERYLARVEDRWGRMEPEGHRERFLANDAMALSALTTALGNSPGMEGALLTLDAPVLMYAGSEDPFHSGARQAAESCPTASFVSLAGLDHDSAFKRSDSVLPHVRRFLASNHGPRPRSRA